MELKYDHLVRWLRSGPLDRTVGKAGDALRCPIAEHLSSVYHRQVSVGCYFYGFEANYAEHKLPMWAQSFTLETDINQGSRYITAHRALEMLGEPTDEAYLVVVVQQGEARCRQPR